MSEILGIFGINGPLLVVQIFNFAVLLLALWYFLYRPVISMIEERRSAIEKGVKDAEKAGEEYKKTIKEKNRILSEATKEGSAIISRAEKKAEEKEALLLQSAEEQSSRILKETEAKAQEDKRRIIESGKSEIAKMAVLGAERVLRKSK